MSVSKLEYLGDVQLFLENGQGELHIFQNDLVRDKGLQTAILISLFTDRRAEAEDQLPDSSGYNGGWWADNTLGSKLWLLQRSKTIPEVLSLAEQYAKDALKWMIDGGIAKSVSVVASRIMNNDNELLLTIQVTQPDSNSNPQTFKYLYNWKSQLLGN